MLFQSKISSHFFPVYSSRNIFFKEYKSSFKAIQLGKLNSCSFNKKLQFHPAPLKTLFKNWRIIDPFKTF